jgi:hypothetical protein
MCEICHERKDTIYFDLNRFSDDGLKYLCTDCDNIELGDNKRCSSCKNILPLTNFAKKNGRGCGYHSQCGKCVYRSKGDKYDDYNKAYRQEFKDKINAYYQVYAKDPQYKIAKNLRNRVYGVLKNQNAVKADHTITLTGCSAEYLVKHLESQFQEGMSWDTYGLYGWHVDHIVPCASFDMTDSNQQKECFHYTNLQPLWAKDNLSKGSSLNWIP